MEATLAILLIQVARSTIAGVLDWMVIHQSDGTLPDEEVAKIKAAAQLSDDAWDAQVAAAKARIAAGQG